jgi:hypothetical protein
MHCKLKLHIKRRLIVSLWCTLVELASGQIGLGLSPLRISLSLKPGQSYTDSLTLNNESAFRVRVRAQLLDFKIDENQEPQFGHFREERQSCAAFLRLSRSDFEIAEHEPTIIRYTLKLPAEANPGTYFCAVGFSTATIPWVGDLGMSINVRVVATFYVTVGPPRLVGTVKQLVIEKDAEGSDKERVVCVLANEGPYVWRPEGQVEVVRRNGQIVEKIPFKALPVLPNRSQRFLFPLSQPPITGDEVFVMFDIGNGEELESRVAVSAAEVHP